MVSLTFFGGVNEIGGNKVLLEDGKTRIFIDFGFSFSKNRKFYSEFLQPRLCNGLGDLLELGIIPNIDGIYRNDLLKNEGRKTSKYPKINGVLLSHAHADHAWHISLLHENMPIYCGTTCKFILKASQETSTMPYYGDFYFFRENFVDRGKKPEHVRDFRTFRSGEVVKIGSLEVKPIHVDHSIPGAYGFVIETSSGCIVYTGDFRLHGPMKNFTREFIEEAKNSEPEILICEGTRINENKGLSEEEVFRKVKGIVEDTKNLVVVNFSPRDIDRFKTFFRVAKETGRRLAINLKQAYLLETLRIHDQKLELPSLDDGNLAIYVHRSGWGRFEERDYKGWERDFLNHDNAINFEDIHKRQKEFIFYCNSYSLNELIDIKPEKGSCYIYSMSEPHNEEQEIDYERMKNWVQHFGLELKEVHASGHACREEIKEVIEEIRPKKVIPIHTEYPNIFKKIWKRVNLVKYGERIKF